MIFDSDMVIQEAYLQHIIEHLPIDRFKTIFKISGDFDEDDYGDFLSPILSDFTILPYLTHPGITSDEIMTKMGY